MLVSLAAAAAANFASVVSDSVWPHRRQPTRLPRPWDSPGKNTGVGCHFLLQCMKVKSESEDAQSFLTLSDPMVWSLPGSSIHGIFQARVLEQGAIDFSTVSLVANPNPKSYKKENSGTHSSNSAKLTKYKATTVHPLPTQLSNTYLYLHIISRYRQQQNLAYSWHDVAIFYLNKKY